MSALGLITIVGAMVGTGMALAGLILPGLNAMRRDIGGLRERMAHLEGLFKGFTGRSRTEAS